MPIGKVADAVPDRLIRNNTVPDLDQQRADVRANAERIAVALFGDPTDRVGNELRFRRKGSLAVVIAGPKAGTWFDHELREGGDLFALIAREHRCDFVHACKIASEILARTYIEPRRPVPPRKELSAEDRRRRALALFKEARPIGGTLAERYLRQTRRIDLDALPSLDHALRFHPSCPFGDERHPCLLALFRDVHNDEPRAIQRIAIASDLSKIGGMAYGSTFDAAIKLSPDDAVTDGLCVAEGVETALSAMLIERRGAWLRPMWALGGTSGLINFPVLAGVERLTIVVDHDPIDPRTGRRAGEYAAIICARRWFAAGRHATRLTPRELGDFNDILVRRGSAS